MEAAVVAVTAVVAALVGAIASHLLKDAQRAKIADRKFRVELDELHARLQHLRADLDVRNLERSWLKRVTACLPKYRLRAT